MANLYGNYDLQLGDSDLDKESNKQYYYAKKYRSAKSGDLIPKSGEEGYVKQLQKDLKELGFNLFPEDPNGKFDEITEWAVREFQVYAKMQKIAVQTREPKYDSEQGDRYVDCLAEQNNSDLYEGSIIGVVNSETRRLIERWKDNKWRCPVIIEAWYGQKDQKKPINLKQALPKENQNIWLPTAVTQEARMFVRDFTEYYNIPSQRFDFSRYYNLSKEKPDLIEKLKRLIVIGSYSKVLKGGPVTYGDKHVWEPETEIRPENFINSGKTYQTLNETDKSTYKVVRAVAEVECEGFFDVINAYDDAYISLGPCHWSLGKKELGGFLAYFQNKYKIEFERLIQFFGASPRKQWKQAQLESTATGNPVFNPDQRLYNSSVLLIPDNSTDKNSDNMKYADYFKTWHWFYRFAMAGREGEGATDFRRSMWEFAVIRIRDILSTPIPKEWGVPDISRGGSTRPAQIGDIYTSEKAVALLLRWHVYRPSQVIIRGEASQLEEKLLFSVTGAPAEIDQLENELNQEIVTTNWQKKFNDASIQGIKNGDRIFIRQLTKSINVWRIKATIIIEQKKNDSFYRIRKEGNQFKIYSIPTLLDGCLRDACQRADSPKDSSNQAILIKGLLEEMSKVKKELKDTASRVYNWPNWRILEDKTKREFRSNKSFDFRLGEVDLEFDINDLDQKLEKELSKRPLSSVWINTFLSKGISLSKNLTITNRSPKTWSSENRDFSKTWSIIDMDSKKEFVIRIQKTKILVYQVEIEHQKGLSEADKSFRLSQEVSTNPIDLPLPASDKPYGGYRLQFEDFDSQGTEEFRYEKRLRFRDRGEPVPKDANSGYVRKLQKDLITLGFLLVPAETGVFDRFTSYAVREFQIQAKMPIVAKENLAAPLGTPYFAKLSAEKNPNRYLGEVTGIVNEATGKLIEQWLKENLRCPVVIQSWTMKTGVRDQPVKGKENLWRLEDLTDETVQVFVKDFSGYYQAFIPPAHKADEWIELGQFFQTGPRSLNQIPENRHCWKESEIFPFNLLGKSPMSQTEHSLFSIFRAIGEAITGKGSCGYFDSIRTQPQHLPFFWLFGLRTDPPGFLNQSQEDLAAYLAYFRFAEPESFFNAFGFFGLTPDRNWANGQGVGDGSSMLDVSQRRYGAGISLKTETEKEEEEGEELVPDEPEAFVYLSSWHWFYRWLMAARTVPAFQKGLWDYGRIQLQNVLFAPWRDAALKINQRPVVLKEVYTSEQAIALIYYWYLRFPEDIITSGKVANALATALQDAGLSSDKPNEWKDADEKKLIEALIVKAKALRTEDDFVRGIDYLSQWTTTRVNEATFRDYQLYIDAFGRSLALNSARNSFNLDDSQVPPPSNQIAQKRVIRLSGAPGLSTFGVFALEEQDSEKLETYRVTAIVLTLLSDNGLIQAETGLRISLNDPVDWKLKLNEEPIPNQELQVLDPTQGTSQAVPVFEIADAAVLPSASTWSLDLTGIQDGSEALIFDAELDWELSRPDGTLKRNAFLDIRFDGDFIDNPPRWTFAAADSSKALSEELNTALISSLKKVDNGVTFSLDSLQNALAYTLPLRLPDIKSEVLVQLVENQIRLKLQTQQEISLNLGSSLAQLKFKLAQLTLDSLDGLSLAVLPDAATQGMSLDLDIFSLAIADRKIINNLWRNVDEFKDEAGEVLESLIRLKADVTDQLSEIEELIVWRDRYPTIHKDLFDAFDKIVINGQRQLSSFAGNVLGTLSPYKAFFKKLFLREFSFEILKEKGLPQEILDLLRKDLTNKLFLNESDFLEAIKELIGEDRTNQYKLTILESVENPKLIQEQGRWKVIVPLGMEIKEAATGQSTPIIQAQGEFGFWVDADPTNPDTYLNIQSGAFAADEKVSLKVLDDKLSSFGALISLYIPKGSIFTFFTDPRKPSITWEPNSVDRETEARIAIRIPATKPEKKNLNTSEDGRFTFEMERFSIGAAGFDLKGSVRVENVLLGAANETGFQEPLAIKGIDRNGNENEQKELRIGEIEFRQSRLVGGSLQAVAKLIYFDDAIATFSLAISQEENTNTLAVVGTLDITGLSEFHVDRLFSTFEISLLHLETTYRSGSWSSIGTMSGRLKFLPAQGRSSSEMGALASLFEGVTVEFEDLNPVAMEAEELKITFPAKKFEFASIFIVELRGVVINPGKTTGFGLLGDINIQRLPGVDSQFTFGGITLTPHKDGVPKFSISRIGAGLSVQGGFEIQGVLEWIDNDKEVGFGGTVTIKSEALGKLDGLIKVTRIKTPEGYVPSLAVYFQKDVDVALFAGFFLRNVGVGLGINQALNGLETKKDLPLPQRIISLVDSPNGLPDPEFLESWVPNPPTTNQINWMLVAAGLITLGKLPPNVEHPLAGRIILAIDQDIRTVAGVNIWLFSSPLQVQQRDFIERPVARGAIAISPKEEQVFGLFRTVKAPKLTPKVPPLLAEVLNKIDTSLMFVGDRNGFLLEVGWPWETNIDYNIGILRGILTSGYRFGIYRGVTSFGLNFAIDIILDLQLGIEASIGPVEVGASLKIAGKGYFRCSFIGALTPDFNAYLLGNVQFAANVTVTGSAYARLSKEKWGISVTIFDLSFKIDFKTSISAVLTAALVKDQIGFAGSAKITVGFGKFSLSGSTSIEYKNSRIKEANDKLNNLLPRKAASRSVALTQTVENSILEIEESIPVWNYEVYKDKVTGKVRILLLPEPNQSYPDIFADNTSEDIPPGTNSRFKIQLNQAKLFNGFLGSTSYPDSTQLGIELNGNELNWREDFYKILDPIDSNKNEERVILTEEEIRKKLVSDVPAEKLNSLTDFTLKDFLITLISDPNTMKSAISDNQFEQIDRRTLDPLAGQADDETTYLSPKSIVSPYFKGEFNLDDSYDQQLAEAFYDQQLAEAFSKSPTTNEVDADSNSSGLSFGQIVAELVTLFKDPQAKATLNTSDYTIAPYLNLILVFDDVGFVNIDQLIDLSSFRVWNAKKGEFQKATLQPLVENTEFNLKTGLVFQTKPEICLTWTFKTEDEPILDSTEIQKISRAYNSLDRFVVTRTILNRPDPEEYVQERLPCWFKKRNSDGFIRPQFQFIDDRLTDSGIQENDLLLYRVQAMTLGDQILAQGIFYVKRQTVKPLQAPTQSLALHILKASNKNLYQQGSIDIKVAFWLDVSGKNDDKEISDKKTEILEQLHVSYRTISSAKVGFYGVEENLGVRTQANEERIAQNQDIRIHFSQSEQSQAMPWEEVSRLPYKFEVPSNEHEKLLMQSENNNPILVIYQVMISEKSFWEEVDCQPGMAVELFVGREMPADTKLKEPLKRSPLIRCRHAILLPTFTKQEGLTDTCGPKDSSLKDFEIGNTVNAIEKLPAQLPPVSYHNPRLIKKGRTNYLPLDTAPVKLAIAWQHLKEQAGEYNPIAAYRLYRADAYSTTEYFRLDLRKEDKCKLKALQVQPELTFRTIPQAMYQANPGTIEVLGRVVKDGQSQKVLTDWQAQSVLEPIWKSTNTATNTFTRLDSNSNPNYPSAPIWVLGAMAEFIKTMQSVLNEGDRQYRPVLRFHYPLEDRSPLALENEGITLRERLDRLIGNLDEAIDPLGWWALETLGLSCECYFEDEEGKRFNTDKLIKELRKIFNNKAQSYPFSIVLMLAEDGKTFLNVFRLVYTGDIKLQNLLLNISNSGDNEKKIEDVKSSLDLKQISDQLVDWLKDIKPLNKASTRVLVEISGEQWRLYDSVNKTAFLLLSQNGKLNIYEEVKPEEHLLTISNSGDNVPKISDVKSRLDLEQFSDQLVDWLKDIKLLDSLKTSVFKEIPGEQWRLYDSNSQTSFLLFSEAEKFIIYNVSFNIDFNLPLGLRIKGRPDLANEIETSLLLKDFDDSGRATLSTWLNQIKARVTASMPDGLLNPGRVIVYRYVGLSGETLERQQLTQVTLPIGSDGFIRHELPVPDRWAHHYAIALEHLRRYDLVWQRLIEPKVESAPEDCQQKELPIANAREIPYNQLKHFKVCRTNPLVPHNIIAMPCIGGIQSLVFVHPAAFAAQASAVNATHGQYSGQHVFLERRIEPEAKIKMQQLYQDLLSKDKWELYQTWINLLESTQLPNPQKSPSLLSLPPQMKRKSVALTKISGTLTAIYGADRYIYPDLPGYYEYRVAVYSTAGRVSSPIKATPYISPLYDQPVLPKNERGLEDQPRQQPRTVPCKHVSLESDTLSLKIRLIHYRYHLRDEIKPLWRNVEDKLNVGVDYGSLPDLYLTYQIYLRENPEEDNFADPVLLPLAEILPPFQKGVEDQTGFRSNIQLTGVTHLGGFDTINLVVQQASDGEEGLEVGELYFQLKLNFSNLVCAEALKKMRNYKTGAIADLFYLSVAREGIWSEIRNSKDSQKEG